jgi:hypothetical protein
MQEQQRDAKCLKIFWQFCTFENRKHPAGEASPSLSPSQSSVFISEREFFFF